MQTVKKHPTAVLFAIILVGSTLTGCGQKGALYLPTSDSKQVVNPVVKPTDATANAYDTKVNTNTQDPNVMLDNNASPANNSATTSSVGSKNDF